jgi:hypothetical protein
MRLLALGLALALSLPAAAAGPPPLDLAAVTRAQARKRKQARAAPAPRPWDSLIESSRAALEASHARPPPLAVAPVVAEPPLSVAALPGPAFGGPNLDFDLLDQAAPAPALIDPLLEQRISTRRTMLTMHQTVGLGLVGLMGATMLTGQLNYLDRFGGPSTARYEAPHKWFATATLVTFAGAGLLAWFTPVPMERASEGIDRATLHKAGMIGATAGMAAEGILGVLTASREGYASQSGLARAHLAIGYLTLLCMSVGVGALVF